MIRLSTMDVPVLDAAIVDTLESQHQPDRTLLVGWNDRGVKALDLLDQIAAPGSVVDVAATEAPGELAVPRWTNLTVGFNQCDTVSRPSLDSLDLASYQHVVVLSDDRLPPDQADDRTLLTLLHLRDIELSSPHDHASRHRPHEPIRPQQTLT